MENTVSPHTLLGAPKDRPANDWPVFKCSTDGVVNDVEVNGTCVARPRDRRGRRIIYLASILTDGPLVWAEREYEVTEITVE